ncbi:hypothetical protein TNIN_142541 [Trichonephila inaurata madagascariensis]|uniref:Uncharacterized protein n=1 Tax=Trichonephila inaurata madagascariensis TaxID=2747483 RepID=A0A8X6ITF4_9ARAC|nr:hypothetical protein TNIN_142541 [Trichonephila inaurata madagascariensis]
MSDGDKGLPSLGINGASKSQPISSRLLLQLGCREKGDRFREPVERLSADASADCQNGWGWRYSARGETGKDEKGVLQTGVR